MSRLPVASRFSISRLLPQMKIALSNRQSGVKFPLRWLKSFASRSLAECLDRLPGRGGPLRQLEEIEVAIVSDECIADVHRQFMDIEGPTDVITFDHGEIVISADTAKANAAIYGKTLEEELALYIIHGLLHLDGFTDKEPEAAAEMARLQEEILKRCKT